MYSSAPVTPPDQPIADAPTSFAPILTTVTNAPAEPTRQSRIEGRFHREKAALEEKLRQQCRTTRKLRTQLALFMEVFRAMATFCENTGSKSESPSLETSVSSSTRTAPTENEEPVVPPMMAAILRNKVTLAMPVRKAVQALVGLKLSEQDALQHARISRNAHKQNLPRMTSLSERSAAYSQSLANQRLWSGTSYDAMTGPEYSMGSCRESFTSQNRRRMWTPNHSSHHQYHPAQCYPRNASNEYLPNSGRKLHSACTPRQSSNIPREAFEQRTSSSGPHMVEEMWVGGGQSHRGHFRSATMAGKVEDCSMNTPDKPVKVLGSIGGMVRTLFTGNKHSSGKKQVKRRTYGSSSRDEYHISDRCWDNSMKKEDEEMNHSHQSSFYSHYRQKSCSGALACPDPTLDGQSSWRNGQ